jgi:hypothetical protein
VPKVRVTQKKVSIRFKTLLTICIFIISILSNLIELEPTAFTSGSRYHAIVFKYWLKLIYLPPTTYSLRRARSLRTLRTYVPWFTVDLESVDRLCRHRCVRFHKSQYLIDAYVLFDTPTVLFLLDLFFLKTDRCQANYLIGGVVVDCSRRVSRRMLLSFDIMLHVRLFY